MVNLPDARNLPIEHLAASFDNTTNSYKFYWFLAILEHIREEQSPIIPINDLLARMVASIWYPTNYFRLSFGKQDQLGQIAIQLRTHASLPIDAQRKTIIQTVQECLNSNSKLAKAIKDLGKYVPYRFLRPFFARDLVGLEDWKVNKSIEKMASIAFNDAQRPCLYRFVSNPSAAIEIQPEWFVYLNRHLTILTDFCLWNLVNYVQKNNPNTPNVPNKLLEPKQRDTKRARSFWQTVFEKLGKVTCIYSGQEIHKGNYSLDHFLPWRFVAHDLLWNIIPTPKEVNSSKSDNLPDLQWYFDSFAEIQYKAVKAIASTQRVHLLEDHILLFKMSSISDLRELPFEDFRQRLYDSIAPQFHVAANMGFSTGWRYS